MAGPNFMRPPMIARIRAPGRVARYKPFSIAGSQYQGMGGVGGSTLDNPATYGHGAPPVKPAPETPQAGYQTDPILAQIQAAGLRNVGDAEAAAKEQTWNALLGFGSQELARKVLGNDPRIQTISDDPNTSFSTLAQIGRAYHDNVRHSDDTDNAANLFYSSARIGHLADESYHNQSNIATATAAVQNRLSQIQDALLAAKQAASDRYLQGLSDSYGRQVQDAQTAPPTQTDLSGLLALIARLGAPKAKAPVTAKLPAARPPAWAFHPGAHGLGR